MKKLSNLPSHFLFVCLFIIIPPFPVLVAHNGFRFDYPLMFMTAWVVLCRFLGLLETSEKGFSWFIYSIHLGIKSIHALHSPNIYIASPAHAVGLYLRLGEAIISMMSSDDSDVFFSSWGKEVLSVWSQNKACPCRSCISTFFLVDHTKVCWRYQI